MKFFISAIVMLVITGTLSAWGTVESVKRIDCILQTLENSKASSENVPSNAIEISEKFDKQWEESEFLISMLLPHHHLDEVKEKLVSLKAYAKTDEFAEWQEAMLVLEEEMLHLRGLITVSTDNIL